VIDPGSAFFDRSREVVASFLQSAVIIDDRISIGSTSSEVDENLDVEEKVLNSNDAADADEAEAPPAPENPIDGRALVDAFAQKGIVCGLVRPDKEELKDLPEKLRGIMIAADIVIIDWFLHLEPEGAKSLVASLIQDAMSSEPHGPRYIVIYSGNPKLELITEQLKERIEKDIPDVRLDAAPFEITCGSCRILVLAKDGTLGEPERSVSEGKLADRIVEDFAQSYCGLVSNVALASVAAIRRNTYRVIRRLDRGMDGAFLTHRALSEKPDEAKHDLRNLVTDEIRAVLEDEGVDNEAGTEVIQEWIDSRSLFSTPLEVKFGKNRTVQTYTSVDELMRLLNEGADLCQLPRPRERTNLSSALGYKEDPDFPDERFAALFTLKPRYTDEAPPLTLGTLLCRRTRKGYEYLVCVQPRCDAVVRAGGRRQFLFLPLEPEGEKGFCTLVPDRGRFVRLLRSRSPYQLRVFEFEAPAAGGDGRVRAKRDGKQYWFDTVGLWKRKLWWRGQLKDIHAQSIATRNASKLSRVGFNTSAWLRRSASERIRDQ